MPVFTGNLGLKCLRIRGFERISMSKVQSQQRNIWGKGIKFSAAPYFYFQLNSLSCSAVCYQSYADMPVVRDEAQRGYCLCFKKRFSSVFPPLEGKSKRRLFIMY